MVSLILHWKKNWKSSLNLWSWGRISDQSRKVLDEKSWIYCKIFKKLGVFNFAWESSPGYWANTLTKHAHLCFYIFFHTFWKIMGMHKYRLSDSRIEGEHEKGHFNQFVDLCTDPNMKYYRWLASLRGLKNKEHSSLIYVGITFRFSLWSMHKGSDKGMQNATSIMQYNCYLQTQPRCHGMDAITTPQKVQCCYGIFCICSPEFVPWFWLPVPIHVIWCGCGLSISVIHNLGPPWFVRATQHEKRFCSIWKSC